MFKLVTKKYLGYVSEFGICQLFAVLAGVILKSLVVPKIVVPDLNWIGQDISSDRAHNSEHFDHFSFLLPVLFAAHV